MNSCDAGVHLFWGGFAKEVPQDISGKLYFGSLRGRGSLFGFFPLSTGLADAIHQKLFSLHGISLGHIYPRHGLIQKALHGAAFEAAEMGVVSGASRSVQGMSPKTPGTVSSLDLVNNPVFLKKGQIAIEGNAIPLVAQKLHDFSVAQRFFRAVEKPEKLQAQRGEAYVVGCENMGIFVHIIVYRGSIGGRYRESILHKVPPRPNGVPPFPWDRCLRRSG